MEKGSRDSDSQKWRASGESDIRSFSWPTCKERNKNTLGELLLYKRSQGSRSSKNVSTLFSSQQIKWAEFGLNREKLFVNKPTITLQTNRKYRYYSVALTDMVGRGRGSQWSSVLPLVAVPALRWNSLQVRGPWTLRWTSLMAPRPFPPPSTADFRKCRLWTCQVTISILYCYLDTIRGQRRKIAFSANAQSRRFASVVLES